VYFTSCECLLQSFADIDTMSDAWAGCDRWRMLHVLLLLPLRTAVVLNVARLLLSPLLLVTLLWVGGVHGRCSPRNVCAEFMRQPGLEPAAPFSGDYNAKQTTPQLHTAHCGTVRKRGP
jgi:hypothetical protein